MNINTIRKNIESLLEDIQDLQEIKELKTKYGLTPEEIEGYIEFFADNRISRGFDEHNQRRDN